MATHTRRINLYINGRAVQNNIKGIRTEILKLNRVTQTLDRNSRQYVQNMARIRYLNTLLDQHNAKLKATVINLTSIKGLANAFNKFMPMVMGFIGTFIGLAFGTKRVAEEFAAFDDKIADVMKVTKKARHEVIALNEALKKMDTRSSQETLLDLAWVAGKLGIHGTEDILGFVNAADKIAVALAKDLGGDAEEALRAIGKAVEIFGLKETYGIETAMLKVGSAVNELGMASIASEGYLLKFIQRVAGIAPLAKISIQDIMGLAATLDIFGQSSEVSGTAYSKLMSKMATETELMAKTMGISIQEYITLFSNDANEAMIQLFESIGKDGTPTFTELVKALGDTELEGQRMTAVMGAIANNIDTLRQQQALSNKAFEEGTSVVTEFNIKNTTAQAILEKKQKELKNLRIELGERLIPVYGSLIELSKGFIRNLTSFVEWFGRNYRAVITLTAGIAAYKVVLWGLVKAKTIVVLWGDRMRYYILSLIKYYALLTGSTIRAAAAQKLLLKIKLTSPWLALYAAIAAVTVALIAYVKTKREQYHWEKVLKDLHSEITRKTRAEVEEVENLIRIGGSLLNSTELRILAIERLNEIIPDMLAYLDEEGKLVAKNITAYEDYLIAATNKIRFDESAAALKDLQDRKRILEDNEKLTEQEIARIESTRNRLLEASKHSGSPYSSEQIAINDRQMKNANAALAETRKELEHTKIAIEEVFSQFGISQPTTPPEDVLGPLKQDWERFNALMRTMRPAPPDFSKEAEQAAELESQKRRAQERITEEEHQKELAAIRLRYAKGRADQAQVLSGDYLDLQQAYYDERIKQMNDNEKRIADLISKGHELSPIDVEHHRYHEELKKFELFGVKKADMNIVQNKAFEALEFQHQTNINKIDTKAIKERFDNRRKAFDQEHAVREEQGLKEINQILSLEYAKQKLKEEGVDQNEIDKIKTLNEAQLRLQVIHQDKQTKLLQDHIEATIVELTKLQEAGRLDGLNLADAIFSDEEANEVNEKLRAVREELAKTLGIKKDKTDDPTEPTLRRGAVRVDILGFSDDDWLWFIENIENSKDKVEELGDMLGIAAYAMSNAWSDMNKIIANSEDRALQRYEKNMNARQKVLDNQLERGIISQEEHSRQTELINANIERQRAIIALKQAKRDRNVALANIAINTAVAVSKVMSQTGVGSAALIPLIIAAGALQAGIVLSQPLPEVPGRETGGFLDVNRQQDGKRFRAQWNPNKRGFVNRPTILVGERPEYVIPQEGVNNPSIKPFINILETARLNDNLATFDLGSAIPAIAGRQSGGYINTPDNRPSASPGTASQAVYTDPELRQAVIELSTILKKGIKAQMVYQQFEQFVEKVNTIESKSKI